MGNDNNKRIAKNTIVLYIRMILLMIVSLYTSRVILEALGVEDYGIYNVVGGFVSLLGFFTSSLTNVSQRYLNLGIGSKDKTTIIKYFKQCGTIFFLFSVVTFLLAETIGTWFVIEKLVIPENRLHAAFWVYQFTIISILCSINQVNFLGAIIAHEKMSVYAYLGLFEAFARLSIALIVINSSADHLILYAGLMAAVSVIVLLFHIIYCKIKFDICKLEFCWDKTLVKEMTRFISANIFGCFAWSIGSQGTNVIMNMFFGPVVNAAKGISVQVSAIVSKFTENIMTAVKPQIIKSYAAGDIAYMMTLIFKSSKLSLFIVSILAIPIIIYSEPIIQLWLKTVPEYSVVFSRIVIIESISHVFITPLWIAANATGNIKRNQIYGRLFNLLQLPVSYLLLCLYPNAILPVAIAAIAQYLYLCYCIYDIKKQLNLDISQYLRQVIVPSIAMLVLLSAIGLAIDFVWNTSNIVFIIIKTLLTMMSGVLIAYTLLTKGEKNLVKGFINKAKNKIQ